MYMTRHLVGEINWQRDPQTVHRENAFPTYIKYPFNNNNTYLYVIIITWENIRRDTVCGKRRNQCIFYTSIVVYVVHIIMYDKLINTNGRKYTVRDDRGRNLTAGRCPANYRRNRIRHNIIKLWSIIEYYDLVY